MKKLLLLLVTLTALLSICFAMKPARFKVKNEKQNVVSGRLEGKWQPHVPLTKRLLGDVFQPSASTPDCISFRTEQSVVQTIPEKYDEFLKDTTIYMAGMMTRHNKDYPFILIELFGNPHIVYFRERDGDPMGDAESFNVMLASAKDKTNDLLFIGGDFSNEPFEAYERKQKSNAMTSPQAKIFLDWMKAVKTSNIELFKSLYSDRMKAQFETQGWDAVFKQYQSELGAQFGDFEPTDFELFFQAEDQPHVLKIEFKGKPLGTIKLIEENNQWKMNER
ncbi:MAG: hypothetical protein ACYTBJ_03235 [Planctomycetota bacterium]|jgi:hypothetical protein